jgi:nucleoside-diphosphate-sugar epimerase
VIKRLLITGGSGFMGREVAARFNAEKWEILSLDHNYHPDLEFDSRNDLLGDPNGLLDLMKEYKPHAIIHLAAKSSILESWVSPLESFSYNVTLTKDLVTAVSQSQIECRLVLISSSAVYARKYDSEIREEDSLGPDSPYGMSKLMSEFLVSSLEDFLIIRPFFVIGPGKYGDVISDWCAQIAAAEERGESGAVIRTGATEITRDFLPVALAADAIYSLTTKRQSQRVFNLCSGKALKLSAILEMLQGLSTLTFDIENEREIRSRRNDRTFVVGSPDRLIASGWDPPAFNIEAELLAILEFFRALSS